MCDRWIEWNFMEFWFLRRKWFVRFLVIKIRGLISWNFDFRFEKEVIRSIFGHKNSWINFMEFWFLVLRRKWFVRFLVIKIRGWNVWWMDRAKFHGILIFEKEVIRSIFGHKDLWMGFVMDGWSEILWNFDFSFWKGSDSFDFGS